MKILLLGDSITDMGRNREMPNEYPFAYGMGYSFLVTSKLCEDDVSAYDVINRGVSGDRIVDVYARIKKDCWNLKPDVISLLIGVNDLWHEIDHQNGVETERFEKIYSMFIEDTLKVLPNVKIMLLEPFVLHGSAVNDRFDKFMVIKEYAKIVKKLAEKYSLVFVPLQDTLDEIEKTVDPYRLTFDGIHPMVAGSTIIANEWIKAFNSKIK